MNPAHGHDPDAAVLTESPSNRLIHESSPYLLQHAHNPVDWYPWGDEAFRKAREEGKPIFLSIGYSTCHWCHVMERESFADLQVARLLNDTFVCIKVDREERPDIDQIYIDAAYMLSGTAVGWPLTIIMTPDGGPFFAASYIPRESRYGMTGLLDLIPRISKVWNTQRQKLDQTGDQVLAALRSAASAPPGEEDDLSEEILDDAYEILTNIFDEEHGGFGGAPKFPSPHNLLFLLRYGNRTGKVPAYSMVEKTLSSMRQGGIFDHIGWGFHRYSTDEAWLIPHFEKMLYDQALLIMAYTEAYLATGREEFAKTAKEVIAYILREMADPEGGFYSAEDADSEGREGRFYLWTRDEILDVLGEEDGELISRIFGVIEPGNYIEYPGQGRSGQNVLHMRRSIAFWANELSIPEEDLERFVDDARQKLFRVRERRARPAKDDKILTDWNGLTIAALAMAARAFNVPGYLETAKSTAGFVLTQLRGPDGRLQHRYRDGRASLPATIDDYAFMIWGLIEIYEASFSPGYLQTAVDLAHDMVAHYWDCDHGGFFFTPDDLDVIVRQKPVSDRATPSGNSVAMYTLFLLGRMTANLEFEEMADRMRQTFAETILKSPIASSYFLTGLGIMLGPSVEVVIAGVRDSEDTQAMIRALWSHYAPETVILFRPSDEDEPDIIRVSGFTKDAVAIGERATAYVCINYACDIPTTDIDEMLRLIERARGLPEPTV